jgi:hypothetical protein
VIPDCGGKSDLQFDPFRLQSHLKEVLMNAVEEVEAAALSLPLEDRQRVLQKLYLSINDDDHPEIDLEGEIAEIEAVDENETGPSISWKTLKAILQADRNAYVR